MFSHFLFDYLENGKLENMYVCLVLVLVSKSPHLCVVVVVVVVLVDSSSSSSAHILIGGAHWLLVACVRRGLQCETLQMAAATEEAPVQWIATLVGLIG